MSRTIIPSLRRRRAKGLHGGEGAILEMIARGALLSEVLDRLMLLNESEFPGLLASILLLDPDGKCLRHGAAPSLPAAYTRAVDGSPIGPRAGSCGTAAYRKETVIVTDIQTDPLWNDYRYLAEPHGLRACWSTPIFSQNGKVLGTFAMYYREVRSPNRAELQLTRATTHLAGIAIEKAQLEERLREAQKMEAFGQLAGGIAHDFNNILTAIKGNVSLLQVDGGLSEPERAAVTNEISDAADRAASLTRHLLTFSRRRLMQPQALDLNQIVAAVVNMLRRLIGEHIILETSYAPEAVPVYADASLLEQVLVNLAVNSRDAMAKGGQLILETARVQVGKSEALMSRHGRPGQHARLTVSDTGAGIAAEHLPHIFEPFFTTKEFGKGTGLGLSTVVGIVEQHRGWIEVQSRLGSGTTFHLYLPRSTKNITSVRPVEEPAIRGGTETILLVEDEEAVQRSLGNMLGRYGYQIYTALSAEAASKIWRQHHQSIQLIVTDIVIPGGVSGRALFDKMRSEKPDLKAIFCSGYTDDVLGNDAQLRRDPNFIEKPFAPDKLLRKIRACLDSKEGK
jgi:two-component system cell cycle sensor histidine kinase/response regulator CckA